VTKPKISIITQSINPHRWINLYDQIAQSVGKYQFELITIGPNFPPQKLQEVYNFRYIRDFGCPSRCFQIGVELSDGEYIVSIPDDAFIFEKSLEQCLDFMSDKPQNHGMTVMYNEGGGNQHLNSEYWRGKYHNDIKPLVGVREDWKIAPCFLYNKEYFVSLGGLNCDLHHVNLNGHSVAFVTQARGGEMHSSPCCVFKCGWEPPTENAVLYQVYLENDRPKFNKFWNNIDAAIKYNIKFDNWKKEPLFWPKRYKSK